MNLENKAGAICTHSVRRRKATTKHVEKIFCENFTLTNVTLLYIKYILGS